MTDLAAIRAGLAGNLSTLAGAQVSPYMLVNPTPPAVIIYPSEVTYDLAMGRGLDRWSFTVQGFVSLAADIGAQARLDLWLAPSGGQSVKALLESDKTLGGAADDVQVTTCTGYQLYAREGGGPVIGAEWRVEVLATGT